MVSDKAAYQLQVTTAVDYIEKASNPQHKQFIFHYHITIQNVGSSSVQLLRRHWLITNGDAEKKIIDGDRVVGEQPTLLAGALFSYSSSAVLSTPFGTMQGYYEFGAADGNEFKVEVPLFRLAVPNILQ